MQVAENERGQQQTLNMMGAASTSTEYEQNIRTFLQFNIMQQPQYYQQQEDRKAFNTGKLFFYAVYLYVH
jgi:MADS-box transcription factor